MKIRQTDFAKMLGVSRSNINNLVKRGALDYDINKLIDINHKKTKKYLEYWSEKLTDSDIKELQGLKKLKTKNIAGLYGNKQEFLFPYLQKIVHLKSKTIISDQAWLINQFENLVDSN